MGFQIGSLLIPYYGFFIVLGILVASTLGVLRVKAFHRDVNDFILIAAMVGLGGIVGAKVLYLLVSWRSIDLTRLTDSAYINSLMQGGFVFYGGLIGGVLCLFLCNKWFHVDAVSYIEICLPCVPLVHGFGRLGCAAVGCCYGVPFSSAFSVTYQNSLFAPNNIPLFPVQLTEAVWNFVIVLILLWYLDVLKRRRGLLLYILLYAPMRFLLEFFRYDAERGAIGFFSVSQWISLLLILLAAAMLVRKPRSGTSS